MSTSKKVFRIFAEWNYEKAEEYFNAEVQKGFVLKKARFLSCDFENCEPGEYTVRIMLNVYGRKGKKQLIDFFEETGAEYLGNCGDFLFFRKKTSLGDFEVYSELDSKIKTYKGMEKTFVFVGIANVIIMVVHVLDNFGPLRYFCITLCFLGAALMAFSFYQVHKKKLSLIKERKLHE